MSKVTYEQAFADHAYLWETYGPAKDMTGGYVDQGDLRELLRSPTKVTARKCLVSQIEYWFSVGPEEGRMDSTDPKLIEIAERHDQDLSS
ncbi:hypothetical protein [Sphingomonas sp. CCH5-D11]|uniref:hypothetical protein n=1 Tax=Sphingomonas sp. CCH5-D11 TaxID=1768786 RepID=UPI000831AB78|nr:hypothetical protein [Sphingomonas sp. CCH5-D11]